MKIRSITNVITNSSNETFIMKSAPYEDDVDYVELTWELILNPGWQFDKDLLVYLVRNYSEVNILKDNPFPRTPEIWNPWETASYYWGQEDLLDLWQMFVKENKEAFEGIVGFCWVEGPYDHDYESWEEWDSKNDDLKEQSIMVAGRDDDFEDDLKYEGVD